MLIPHDNYDPRVSDDLYPRNFIVDLPKPKGYFGAEELFGRMDDNPESSVEGIDVIRPLIEGDLNDDLKENRMPTIMERAILSFVLSGAARAQRNQKDFPATMLIHISLRIIDQLQLRELVEKKFIELRDEWRYARKEGIYDKLHQLWEEDFKLVTQQECPDKIINFEELEKHLSSFFESIVIRTLNSATGDVLDYELEPNLKAIAIGGNKLSRGLTLEGLLVSIFARRTVQYDTLMQMGRWFGFREGYEDLTRIFTTRELAEWFSDLAYVEHKLREHLRVYEEDQLTPLEVGIKIKSHPIMQVTSILKRRYASEITVSASYSEQIEQVVGFPFDRLDDLALLCEKNLITVKSFLSQIGKPTTAKGNPVWSGISAEKVIEFLEKFMIDKASHRISMPLIISYIRRQISKGELINWTVAICGKTEESTVLDEVDWGIGFNIKQITRTRKPDKNSIGMLTSPSDEKIGLSENEMRKFEESKEKYSERVAAKKARNPTNGLLLIYPISKKSAPPEKNQTGKTRRLALYENPDDSRAKDLIGIAISFPESKQPQPTEEYIIGTVLRRDVDDTQ